jgi:hypothetical protein
MHAKRKYAVRIDNVYFLKQLGASLREAVADVPKEELPEEIRLALRRLDRLSARQNPSARGTPHDDPAA